MGAARTCLMAIAPLNPLRIGQAQGPACTVVDVWGGALWEVTPPLCLQGSRGAV